MIDWVIYYSNGSTFSSEDGEWSDAPGWDCQVVLFRDDVAGWAMRHGGDYFRLDEDGSIVSMDLAGLIDYIVNVLGVVKVGRMLTRSGFDEIYQRAKADMADMKVADADTIR